MTDNADRQDEQQDPKEMFKKRYADVGPVFLHRHLAEALLEADVGIQFNEIKANEPLKRIAREKIPEIEKKLGKGVVAEIEALLELIEEMRARDE